MQKGNKTYLCLLPHVVAASISQPATTVAAMRAPERSSSCQFWCNVLEKWAELKRLQCSPHVLSDDTDNRLGRRSDLPWQRQCSLAPCDMSFVLEGMLERSGNVLLEWKLLSHARMRTHARDSTETKVTTEIIGAARLRFMNASS
eukprot:115464-Amphidinium_carterae.1